MANNVLITVILTVISLELGVLILQNRQARNTSFNADTTAVVPTHAKYNESTTSNQVTQVHIVGINGVLPVSLNYRTYDAWVPIGYPFQTFQKK